jgi:adenosylcobinamide kinase / adenosylcobinamide-phosphate guanylyltransferase
MIHYISGGERSGKSSFASDLALQLSQNPIYLATSRVLDDDFSRRVKLHQLERDSRWTSIEEELSHLFKKDNPNSHLIIISNEIGMGLHAPSHLSREFVER